ncbi:MAG: phospholipase D-like domain-containing protein [Caulobacteraceae bacterium]
MKHEGGISSFEPGRTCWRTERADRCAFLVDYQAYFSALREALQLARRQITILGWGFDPRARLAPDGHRGGRHPDAIAQVLMALCADRPELEVRILAWKSALPVSASQEFFPHRARAWFKGSRVHFELDDAVPFGACHHQKVVVIDDVLAFSGSGDIACDRWDSEAHLADDARRIMPGGARHGPRHEVMSLVSGPAAKALGDLARERWRRMLGEEIIPPPPLAPVWPASVTPDLSGAATAIARTEPAWAGRPCTEENEALTLALIAEAKTTLYLENQYFTAPVIAEALAARLGEPEGPEIILVSTGRSPSWFDQLTMDRARAVQLWRLRAADIFGRFRAWQPCAADGQRLIVHSKVMVIDDRIARVGSANLNNRSGGFDTECDLAFEAADETQRAAIAGFRDHLLAHFVSRKPQDLALARERAGGSLIAAVEALNHGGRLTPIEAPKMTAFGELIARHHLGDPASVTDAWRPVARRERLYDRARLEIQSVKTISATSGR